MQVSSNTTAIQIFHTLMRQKAFQLLDLMEKFKDSYQRITFYSNKGHNFSYNDLSNPLIETANKFLFVCLILMNTQSHYIFYRYYYQEHQLLISSSFEMQQQQRIFVSNVGHIDLKSKGQWPLSLVRILQHSLSVHLRQLQLLPKCVPLCNAV